MRALAWVFRALLTVGAVLYFANYFPAAADVLRIGETYEGTITVCILEKDIQTAIQADMDGTLGEVWPALLAEHKCGMLKAHWRVSKVLGSYEDNDQHTLYVAQVEILFQDDWRPAYTLFATKPLERV